MGAEDSVAILGHLLRGIALRARREDMVPRQATTLGQLARRVRAVEIYGHGRFFTMTGKSNGVLTITDHQTDIEALIGNLDGDHPGRQAALIDGTIKYGTPHNTLASLAGTMHRRGMSLEAIEAALLVVNRTQCERPGPEENIRKIVGSMAKWRR